MYNKPLYFALIALLITSVIDAKKTRRNKRPRDEECSTPQPNVVTYSTFGFNDVGSYNGFVPSSPDYTNYFRNFNSDTSAPTRLYAPAFPTALDHEGYGSSFSSQDTQPSGPNDDNIPQASMLQYPQSSVSFYNTPSLESSDPRNQHGVVNELFGQNIGEVNAPIYGTKLGSRNRNKFANNNTEENVFSSGSSDPMDSKYSTYREVHSSYENKPLNFGESEKNYQSHFNYMQTYSPSESEDAKKMPTSTQSPLKFPRVIDFTKFKQYYPSGPESKITTSTSKPTTTTVAYNPWPNSPNNNENVYTNNFEDFRTKFPSPGSSFTESHKENDDADKPTQSPLKYTDVDYSSNNYLSSSNRDQNKETKFGVDYKDKFKYKQWPTTNFTENDYKIWKNPFKGYQYSTNASNMTFEFDFSGLKKPANDNNDEIVPESTNVDPLTYNFPGSDYSSFKKIPPIKGSFGDFSNFEDFENSYQSSKHIKYDPADYVRSLYVFSTVPTTTSHWGNVYPPSEYNTFKYHGKKPHLFEELNDEIVHIPKRPYGSNKYNYGKYSDAKPTSEWSTHSSYRPYKSKKNKESTRFKSEEDLLGLRTHDTSHPSYLPTYRPNSLTDIDEYDYKKLVEKWRQSYLKAKYKDFARDYESYSSEPKPIHVPVPKPYAIEVPHPVIVPVPQPYPVRVPVPKPVAVPVVQEITVPVEKPVPYPVVKKVPYPVEKYVPVKVEKEVKVPVMKPYPVPIPQIRPVFHHTRPRDEEDNVDDDDDFERRPEPSKKVPYAKRIKSSSTRTRSRRPSRTYHQPHHTHSPSHSYREDRTRRRWPLRHTSSHKRNPTGLQPQPFRASSDDLEEQEYDAEFSSYCKRTRNC